MIVATAAMCLALNIYHESRGESLAGQHAVAQVTWNRAGHDHKKVCTEVTKSGQFSWTPGKLNRQGGRLVLTDAGTPKEKKSWEMAKAVAQVTLLNWVPDITKGATFYHANYVSPSWSKKLKLVSVIGAHRFYKFA